MVSELDFKLFKAQYVAVGMMQNKDGRDGIWGEVSSELGMGERSKVGAEGGKKGP